MTQSPAARTLALEPVLDRFPPLRNLDAEALRVFAAGLDALQVPAGTYVFTVGSPCERYLLLLEGSVRVQHTAECGREIVLYRIGPGDTCILTAASLLALKGYAAEGIAETPVRAVALDRRAFETLMARSATFRAFVFETYATRLVRLLSLVEEVAFRRVDVRLAQRLLDLRDPTGRIAATHQDLALELGTAREVVSRQLKEFERRGWITLSRGRIAIEAAAALADLAGEAGR